MGNHQMNYLRSSTLLVVIASSLYGCVDNEKPNDFDMVCQYFQELDKADSESAMSLEQRNKFITDRLNKNLPSSSATVSWEAVSYAVPGDRYEIFKTGAEAELGKEWNCSAMEKLAPLTGIE